MRGYFNEPGSVAVYLLKHLRDDTLKHVGEKLGIEKYSTVSSIVERLENEMKAGKGFKNRIQKLDEEITKSQRQTPSLLGLFLLFALIIRPNRP